MRYIVCFIWRTPQGGRRVQSKLEPDWAYTRPSRSVDRFGDASTSRLGCPGLHNREDIPQLVAVGQPLEEPKGCHITVERIHEVRRHAHLTRLSVEFDLDVHFIACSYTST